MDASLINLLEEQVANCRIVFCPIQRGFAFKVPPDISVALVGQRFYDPSNTDFTEGIIFDGVNARTLAPNWIRRQIGVVLQEPNLLDLTIRENIAYGLNYRFENPEGVTSGVLMEAIIEAAKQANAHDFISNLPEQYETRVGPRGSRLSGGQKQRIAIARALVRDPRLLVLDEAAAALDNESERVVQAALDEAMKKGGRTCLVVAHRLTTVEACDLVVVLERGRAVEWGTPSALLEVKGTYHALRNAAPMGLMVQAKCQSRTRHPSKRDAPATASEYGDEVCIPTEEGRSPEIAYAEPTRIGITRDGDQEDEGKCVLDKRNPNQRTPMPRRKALMEPEGRCGVRRVLYCWRRAASTKASRFKTDRQTHPITEIEVHHRCHWCTRQDISSAHRRLHTLRGIGGLMSQTSPPLYIAPPPAWREVGFQGQRNSCEGGQKRRRGKAHHQQQARRDLDWL